MIFLIQKCSSRIMSCVIKLCLSTLNFLKCFEGSILYGFVQVKEVQVLRISSYSELGSVCTFIVFDLNQPLTIFGCFFPGCQFE